jgi:hypothetical protein
LEDWGEEMTARKPPQKYGELWTRQELILAFDLYCRIPFKKTKTNNPEVIGLAKLLRAYPIRLYSTYRSLEA